MPQTTYLILQATDDALLGSLERIWEGLGAPADASLIVSLLDNSAKQTSAKMSEVGGNSIILRLRNTGAIVLREATLSLPSSGSSHVTVTRDPLITSQPVVRQSGLDQVSINLPDQLPVAAVADLVTVVRQGLREFDVSRDLDKTLGPALAEFYRRREHELSRLEDLSRRLIEENVAYRERLDSERTAEKARSAEELQRQAERLKSEYDRASLELDVREADLTSREKSLDDRSSTHARRQIHIDFLKKLADRSAKFSLSPTTNKKRLPIHILFITLILATGAVLGTALRNDLLNGLGNIPATVEFGLSAVSFIGAVGFYIRWSDVWARRHANEEFMMQRLGLDFDRASWVVESSLEFEKETKTPIPAELLARLSAHLFADSGTMEQARHPAEDLANAILGASSGIRFKTPGAEVNLDRKGIKQLRSSDSQES